MRNSVKILIIIALTAFMGFGFILLFVNKNSSDDKGPNSGEFTISVSIAPIKYLVDRITGGEYPVNVILPAGSGPETYEPTPKQLKQLESSPLIFVTGLIHFENSVASKVTSSKTSVIRLDKGIQLIEGECNHHDHTHSHSHGVDPHIWTSISCLKIMAANILSNLPEKYIKENFIHNYEQLILEMDELDTKFVNSLKDKNITAFLIYHPALTYYARDYGLEQIQLEQEGKEPSADKLIRTISKAKELGLDKVLYQSEFSIKAVETAAKDIGAVPVVIDPLAEDILANMQHITEIIVGK